MIERRAPQADQSVAAQVRGRLGRAAARRRAGTGTLSALRRGIEQAAEGTGEVGEINAWVLVKPDETCVIRVRARKYPRHGSPV